MSKIIVPPFGPSPCDVLLLGEAPGSDEAFYRPNRYAPISPRPFVGKSGEEQSWYLQPYNITPNSFRLANVIPEYTSGNPDPTIEQINHYTPQLIREIHQCNPKLIIAIGRFAMKWLLGNDADLDSCHGLIHKPGEFDPSISNRCPKDSHVIVGHHPAFGLHQNRQKGKIAYDYEQIAKYVNLIRTNQQHKIIIPTDEYEGKEQYFDVTGHELSITIKAHWHDIIRIIGKIAIDTEGVPSAPWSIQISWKEGQAYCLRCSQPDFYEGINTLQDLINTGITVLTHCASTPLGTGYDIIMSRAMGLDLSRVNIRDTMYNIYLLRRFSKGLKSSMWRWGPRMKTDDYMDLIRGKALDRQIDYLTKCVNSNFSWPEARILKEPDGSYKRKRPKCIQTRAEKFIHDALSGKLDSITGKPIDLYSKWYDDILPHIRQEAESKLGPFPYPTLDDIDREEAVYYACLSNASLVETEEGPQEIGTLVRSKYSGKVWSVNNQGERQLQTVTGWYKIYQWFDIKWYSVETEYSRRGRWGLLASRFTGDHKLLTRNGWTTIQEIAIDDEIATGMEALTKEQYQLVLGSILGDGSLSRRNDNGWVQFRFSHSEKQYEYLQWKKSICWGNPTVSKRESKDYLIADKIARSSDHFQVSASAHPQLINLRNLAYSGEKNEIVVSNWVDTLDVLGLAIWYQDDGTLVVQRYARIYTLSMKLESIKKLIEVLFNNFGIVANYYQTKGANYSFGGFVLTVGAQSADLFYSLIAKYIHPTMRYKLPEKYRDWEFVGNNIEQTKTGQLFAKVKSINQVKINKKGNKRTCYCIDVENNHNFITSSGEVAHNCRDADGTLRIDEPVLDQLREIDIVDSKYNSQFNSPFPSDSILETSRKGNILLPFWERLQSNGLPASHSELSYLSEFMELESEHYRKKICQAHFPSTINPTKSPNGVFNPNSPVDTLTLINKLGIRLPDGRKFKTKANKQKVDKKTIEYLRYSHPEIDWLFQYREHLHIKDSFCTPYLESFNGIIPDIQFITSILDPAVTESRRCSSSKPNLLNVPSRTEIGRLVRSCFLAPDDYVLISVDYSGMQLRIMADESNCPILSGVFNRGEDAHKDYAKFFFGKQEISKDERYFGKTMNFSVGFGMIAMTIHQQLLNEGIKNFTLQQCKDAELGWWERYYGVKQFKDALVKDATKKGYVRSKGGMIRYLPNLRSKNSIDREEAARHVFSHYIQDGEQNIIQNAMLKLWDRQKEFDDYDLPIKFLLQYHDEMLTLSHKDYAEMTVHVIKDAFINHCGVTMRVPIVTDHEIATNWGDL